MRMFTCITEFSCTRKGLNSRLCSHGLFCSRPRLVLMPVQHLSSAKAISAAGMPRPGMIPADPRLSLSVMMAKRKPSKDPAARFGADAGRTRCGKQADGGCTVGLGQAACLGPTVSSMRLLASCSCAWHAAGWFPPKGEG